MSLESLDQQRAKLAWGFVSGQGDALKAKYYSLIRSFPSMVQSMGIGQSLAFLMAKNEEEHKQLLRHLTAWLCDPKCPIPWSKHQNAAKPKTEQSKLFEVLLAEKDPEVWWYADQEAIEFSIWLKRFSEALKPAEKAKKEEKQ